MVGSQEEAAEVRKVGYRANLVKTTKREQNPVVVKMLLRELSKDADLLALRVKPIKEGEDEMSWKIIIKNERILPHERSGMTQEQFERRLPKGLSMEDYYRRYSLKNILKYYFRNKRKLSREQKEKLINELLEELKIYPDILQDASSLAGVLSGPGVAEEELSEDEIDAYYKIVNKYKRTIGLMERKK